MQRLHFHPRFTRTILVLATLTFAVAVFAAPLTAGAATPAPIQPSTSMPANVTLTLVGCYRHVTWPGIPHIDCSANLAWSNDVRLITQGGTRGVDEAIAATFPAFGGNASWMNLISAKGVRNETCLINSIAGYLNYTVALHRSAQSIDTLITLLAKATSRLGQNITGVGAVVGALRWISQTGVAEAVAFNAITGALPYLANITINC